MGGFDKKLDEFTKNNVEDKELVIKMLKYEDQISRDETIGQEIYRSVKKNSLEAIYTIHRLVLLHFGFNSKDSSVLTYRTIFAHYYTSPEKYDKDVLSAVHYMRENKCVYNPCKKPKKNELFDSTLKVQCLTEAKTKELKATVEKDFEYAFFMAFSST